ncbi:hypothetical protein [Burkholderia sp. LMG 13014]|uniref:hypothetical protein n=1 Tax=Burkholderia sp. LMG 13014 TaxID=2709306 RepID=UPI001965FCA2|nr:hypothetical protein [Burkholderia sp. LMG 13014]
MVLKILHASILGLLASTCLLGARPASAECHVAASTIILCQDANSAAYAYNAFGLNTAKMNASYNRQILHESGCSLMTDPKRGFTFKRRRSGEIATPNGWVGVMFLDFAHDGTSDAMYVASRYISGSCPDFKKSDIPTFTPEIPKSLQP